MNTDKLSKRLEAVAAYIPHGSRLADIGSDHAYLPCYAVKNGVASSAIAGEVVDGPYQSAKRQVTADGLTDKIAVRKGSGLDVIEHGEVDCITIAGMGGPLIASILEAGKRKLAGHERLILQPNISAVSIRVWLMENGWVLCDEAILEEDGKIYEILVAEMNKGDQIALNEKELLFGPFLLREKSNVFIKKWQAELKNWKHILDRLQTAAGTEENLAKKREIEAKIQFAEEVLDT